LLKKQSVSVYDPQLSRTGEITDNKIKTKPSILSPIKSFAINGLFGRENLKITFPAPCKILIAENGRGKTTVLNCLYALLSGNLNKLRKLPFESLLLIDKQGTQFLLKKEWLLSQENPAEESQQLLSIRDSLTAEEFEWSQTQAKISRRESLRGEKRFLSMATKARIPFSLFWEILYQSSDSQVQEECLETLRLIKKTFPARLFYFPTYRRIEENPFASELTIAFANQKDSLIQFGMSDVQERIKTKIKIITQSVLQWIADNNRQALEQLVDPVKVSDAMLERVKNLEQMEIVLDRLGESLSKEKVLALVSSPRIKAQKYNNLVALLCRLLDSYEQQKVHDAAIIGFITTCNHYLVDKRFIYDANQVTVELRDEKNDFPLELEQLSLGEKQIVSLFSFFYLEEFSECFVLFDEPELSISMEWQKRLLPDILATGRCSFLLAATHSPFIIDNELSAHTVALDEYFQRR